MRGRGFPKFLIIGAQKAGTTWLHRNLQSHPGIWMPKEKELHYFDEKAWVRHSLLSNIRDDGPENIRWRRQLNRQAKSYKNKKQYSLGKMRRELAWDLRYFLTKPRDEWYASLFDQGWGKVTGEATPDYSALNRDAIARAHALMPQARIIFMMRSPIERLWSQALMGLRFDSPEAVEEATDEQLQARFYSKRALLLTDYKRTLTAWGEFYPEEAIFAGFLEDVHFRPDELMENLYRFLGVNPLLGRRAIKRKIHTRKVEKIPTRFASHIASHQLGSVEELEREFGGYASFWAHCARRLSKDPPEADNVAYPFWETEMWEEWTDERGGVPGLQSSSLSSLRAAK